MKAREIAKFLVGISDEMSVMELNEETPEERIEFVKFYTGFRPKFDIPNGDYILMYSRPLNVPYYVESLMPKFDYTLTDKDGYYIHLLRIED